MVVHPQNLPDKTLLAIDQYVLKGGKALVFVDPYSEAQASAPSRAGAPGGNVASNLEPLFKAWGVKLLPSVVAGDRANARRVGVPVPGRGPQPMDYIAWLELRAANLNREDPITADIDRINMATAGILEPVEGAKTNFVPLISTSAESTKIPVDKAQAHPRGRRAAYAFPARRPTLCAGRAHHRAGRDRVSRRTLALRTGTGQAGAADEFGQADQCRGRRRYRPARREVLGAEPRFLWPARRGADRRQRRSGRQRGRGTGGRRRSGRLAQPRHSRRGRLCLVEKIQRAADQEQARGSRRSKTS